MSLDSASRQQCKHDYKKRDTGSVCQIASDMEYKLGFQQKKRQGRQKYFGSNVSEAW